MAPLTDFGEVLNLQKAAAIFTGLLVVYGLGRCIYNIWFHPLAAFPGPRLAAISNAYYGKIWFSGRYPWKLEKLFQKYGDIVRVAPNELVFNGPRAYSDIYGSAVRNRETFTKTDFQDIGENEPGITAERDPDKHREIAKQLHPAFAARSLRRQEEIIHVHIDRFVQLVKEKAEAGEAVPMKEWFDWLTFDIAGDMAYGRQFENVEQSKATLFLSTFQRVGPWGTYHQVFKRFPLLHPFVWLLVPPKVALTVPTLLRMNREKVRERLAEHFNKEHNDYINFLLPKSQKNQLPTEDWALAQANVLIVAGFDPMTNLLSSGLYYLLKTPRALERLNEEIRGAFKSYDDIRFEGLQSLRYLHAVLDEALRIHTNAAFGQPRKSPGAMVDGRFIPEGAVVQTCMFSTTHDPRNFVEPRAFHPERFLPEGHKYHEPRFSQHDNFEAFTPFSQGPRGCPGSAAAYLQAKIVLAKLVWKFDVEFAGKPPDWENELRMYAVWSRPEVLVRFSERKA